MRGLLSIAILACVLGTGAVRADEVVLRSGGKLSCEVIEVTDELVTVRLARGIMEIPRAKVKEIRRESKQRYLEREARRSTRSGSTATALELSERAWREARGDESVRRRLVDALEAHARALVKQFRYRDAEFTLRKLKRHAPGHRAVAELTRAMEQGNARARELLDGAQAALQNGRLEEAIRILEAWRLRRPPDDAEARATMARAYLLAGRSAASETRLRAALDHYRAASAFGGSSDARRPLYLLTPIAVLESIREGDLAGARRELRGIATTYPHPATPVFLRAVLSHVSGDVTGAVRGYSEAARLAERKVARPSGVSYDLAKRYASATLRAAIARPPSEGVSRWREVFLGSLSRYDSGKYFVVYAPTPAAAEETARAADAVYARIARDLLGRIPTAPRAEIVLHPTRQAYVAADPAPPGSPIRDASVPREKTAGLCYDTLDEKGKRLVRVESFVARDWLESTLPHELVHVVQRRGLPAFRRGKWLDEGLAMLYEDDNSRRNRAAFWRTLKKSRIPLPELLALRSIPPERVGVFYAQAHAFTTFLRDQGDARQWTRFLAEFGKADLPTALRRVYEIEDLATLERRWLQQR